MRHSVLTEILTRQPPDVLYHYTTQAGLLGIIRKKEIWATHTQYLNDRREYLHAIELVQQEIKLRIEKAEDEIIKTTLEEMREALYGIENTNVCVCSFSEVKDSLSQWRAYGEGMSGFAIGFSGGSLAEVFTQQQFYLVPCLYSQIEQVSLVRALVDEVLQENLERDIGGKELFVPPGGNLWTYLDRYGPILKDATFSEEKEWRIITKPLMCTFDRFDYRQGKSMLIPYYRLPLADSQGRLQIEDVVIGPTPHVEQSKHSLVSFLMSQGLLQVSVSDSAVPYRSW